MVPEAMYQLCQNIATASGAREVASGGWSPAELIYVLDFPRGLEQELIEIQSVLVPGPGVLPRRPSPGRRNS